ncbi:ABC transporter permease [Cellulomonas soli]|uniref:ABC transporter permease n=1 Tax=Cellulomonas soli TaxID=931535 RepID=A0A512PDS0_9CELL|nr:ABC transporter permease [Cellulomonas soli]NYI60050.1 peptide/nickel transport system permease protein [Cellulomonas soli]GEP69296.1 ABC transporter permease [Cellulomonas soli]
MTAPTTVTSQDTRRPPGTVPAFAPQLGEAPGVAVRDAGAPGRRRTGPWRTLRRQPGLVLALLVLVTALAWAVVPGAFTPADPITGIPAERLQAPSGLHPFGTDHLGRDLFARVVHGSALSLRATVVAVVVGLVAGSALGLLAGYLRGWVDDLVGRLVDVLLAVPGLLLSLAIVTVLGFGSVNVAIAVGLTSVASFARVMRAEALRTSTSVYVEAARASGARWYSVVGRHVLPNSTGPVVALGALEFGTAILAISALSFLGYGAAPPAPEWGSLVSEGRSYLATAWWLATFPGLVIAAVVLAANRVARALEPQQEEDA